ncbi:uncharacterized protein EI90DRAFT_3036365 [Cantharellus anzutake]|uniref:uncharacterized protein n=1 Tax=Cantharellus anzutake TaxID=1750568 RepID=UPI0019059545|nr:uncharacterized protein EI90DRAFT_3036365 [Cantharellus anzutake]KAF8340656.1 hypothetical protein EI90DRAFT_3036365 [Cantharellus anzutake]
MGIHELAPFLQKTCPDVIREALAGKTITVDGILVTQRLHFLNIPYEFKHILGWYRLLMERNEVKPSRLRQNGDARPAPLCLLGAQWDSSAHVVCGR